MPNWVYNTITIEDEEAATKVFDFMKTSENDFDYDQVTNNWEVKWNACEVEFIDNGVTFNSPWGHPDNVIYELSKKFPDVEFSIRWEEEQGFGKEYDIHDGSLYDEYDWDMPEYHTYTDKDGYECYVREYKTSRPGFDVGFYRDDYDECFPSLEMATVGYLRRNKLNNYNPEKNEMEKTAESDKA